MPFVNYPGQATFSAVVMQNIFGVDFKNVQPTGTGINLDGLSNQEPWLVLSVGSQGCTERPNDTLCPPVPPTHPPKKKKNFIQGF